MKKDLIIFGTGKIADIVFYYAQSECGFNVKAFCVDEEFKTSEHFNGLPVISFQSALSKYPPVSHDMFVAVGYQDLNRLRERKCDQAREKGYELVSIISPEAKLPQNVTTGWNCFIMPPAMNSWKAKRHTRFVPV